MRGECAAILHRDGDINRCREGYYLRNQYTLAVGTQFTGQGVASHKEKSLRTPG